ncbi:hypothetical protein ACHAXA_001203 [Cyclostephanos tholiformis]|uniref:PDZ domain-containing protein n=1 Tax=Cyclostephanos tholiformis TaxID=382380 RepID=A0ABD3SQH3_9STRA
MMETAAQMVGTATLMLENATRNFKSAKDNLDKSRDEVRAAEALMREAEERWMEIVIDDETSTAPPSNKRRRVLASPPTTGGVSNAVTVGESMHGNGNIVAAAGSPSGQSSVSESNAPTMISSSSGGYVAAATASQSSHCTGNISGRTVVSNAAGNRNIITAVGLTAGGSSVGESNVPAMIVSPPGGRTTGKSSHGTGNISGAIGTAAFSAGVGGSSNGSVSGAAPSASTVVSRTESNKGRDDCGITVTSNFTIHNGKSSSSRSGGGREHISASARRAAARTLLSKATVVTPPGKLGIILANRTDLRGTVVAGVRTSSVLANKVSPGDRIIAVDGEDVSQMNAQEITTIMARKCAFERVLVLLATPKVQYDEKVTRNQA